MVELIPGTSLPLHTGPGGEQPEGRGDVTLTPNRHPPSLLDKISDPDYLSGAERIYVETAIRAYDKRKILEKEEYFSTATQTDATTGNAVVQLFEVPHGKRGDVVSLTVDAPGSATITPAAPFANGASWEFIAIAPASTSPDEDTPLRQGLAAFAPTSVAGPIIPGQWTFNDSNAPVAWGGEAIYYVLIGGSQAAILNLWLQFTVRINLYSHT